MGSASGGITSIPGITQFISLSPFRTKKRTTSEAPVSVGILGEVDAKTGLDTQEV